MVRAGSAGKAYGMTAGSRKSIHNPCPICDLPRGKGPYEFSHGKCAEVRAQTEGKNPAYEKPIGRSTTLITVEQREKARNNAVAKKYKKGKLPPWMFD